MSGGGYTTSYRWAGVTRSKVAGLIRHDARDVDRQNGVEVSHSNAAIDPAMTARNETFVNDGAGRFAASTSSQQWLDFIDKRVGEARNFRTNKDGTQTPVAVRADANVVVEVILQLDPEFTGKCADMDDAKREEVRELLQVMIDTEIEHIGAGNVVGWAVHWDETHPHVQMMTIPMIEDGQLSMKQVYKGSGGKASAAKEYTRLHDVMRTNLQAAGYDATMERVDAARSHLPLDKFKALRDQQTQAAADAAKVEAKLSVASKDSDAAYRDRRAARSDRATAAAELDAAREEAPRIRRRAREEGRREGYEAGRAEARDELAQERREVQAAADAASAAQRAAHAAQRDAEALSDELAEALDGDGTTWSQRWADGQGLGDRYRQDRARAEQLRRKARRALGPTSAQDHVVVSRRPERPDDQGIRL